MKNFNIIVPTEIVATVSISKRAFETRFEGLPDKLEAFVKKIYPEYETCKCCWSWEYNDNHELEFQMQFIADGDPIIEPK